MGGRTQVRTVAAAGIAMAAAQRPAMRAEQQHAEAPSAALVALAEELGRLLARRELDRTTGRRAYALPELLLGASVMAVVWVLIARFLGWLAN